MTMKIQLMHREGVKNDIVRDEFLTYCKLIRLVPRSARMNLHDNTYIVQLADDNPLKTLQMNSLILFVSLNGDVWEFVEDFS